MQTAPRIAPAFCTDYALCNALGTTRAQVLDRLAAGHSGLGPPSLQLSQPTRTGEIPALLPPLPPAFASYDCRIARLAMLLAEQMRESIVRVREAYGADRVAVVLATSTGGLAQTEEAHRASLDGLPIPGGYSLARTHSLSATAELVAQAFALLGPAFVISTACSSSAKSLASAQRLIHTGVADAVIAGGLDTLCGLTLSGFASLGILSPAACRPFAPDRDGINIGEGGAFLLLERQGPGTVALLGAGETSDAHHMSAPDPQGLGAERAMRAALAQAHIDASDVGYINAHGTGTPLNDAAEAMAIERVFGLGPVVVSTKGYTGHMLGAAGATEAAFCVAALERSSTPASLGATEGALGLRIGLANVPLRTRFALTNSFAFGGSNISLVFGKASHE